MSWNGQVTWFHIVHWYFSACAKRAWSINIYSFHTVVVRPATSWWVLLGGYNAWCIIMCHCCIRFCCCQQTMTFMFTDLFSRKFCSHHKQFAYSPSPSTENRVVVLSNLTEKYLVVFPVIRSRTVWFFPQNVEGKLCVFKTCFHRKSRPFGLYTRTLLFSQNSQWQLHT